jgi:hypothetical protein
MFSSVLVYSELRGFKKGTKHMGKKRAACTCAVAFLSLQHRRKKLI